MLIIKTDFQINDHFLSDLSNLIHGEVKQISSWGSMVNLESSDKSYDNLFIFFSVKDACYKLSVRSLFFYNINIDDDVTTLKMSFGDDNNVNCQDAESAFLGKQSFNIHKIKIYGEERIRIWSEMKKINYFHKKVDIKIADYYFNNTIIRFESSDDRFINIYTYTNKIYINFDKNLNLENDFYLVSDLNMEEDFVNNEVWTTVQKIKCHYEIDQDGVKKHINQGITLHG